MRVPKIELLWWEGCPSTERARRELDEALEQLGLLDASVQMRQIRTHQEANGSGFRGSPTILIDGLDLAPIEADEEPGLSCRVYRRRDGRISPTPDPDDLREGLRRAAQREELAR